MKSLVKRFSLKMKTMPKIKLTKTKIAELIATFFYVGKIKFAPGTFGSIAAFVPFALLLNYAAGNEIFWLVVVNFSLFFIGLWSSSVHGKSLRSHDASEIVIDEVFGQFLVLSVFFMQIEKNKYEFWIILLPLLLFRVFDIFKPWPVSWFDRNVKNAFGVMMDDFIAAIFAIVFTILFLSFF